MAGYGGQLVALNVQTPAEAAQTVAQSAIWQQKAAEGQLDLNAQQQLYAAKQARIAALQSAAQSTQTQASTDSPLATASGTSTGQPLPGQGPPPQSQLARPPQTLFDPRVQQVMSSINPDDPDAAEKWDAGMSQIADTVPQAKQFVGHYSRPAVDAWRAASGDYAVASGAQQPPSQFSQDFASAFAPRIAKMESPLAAAAQQGQPQPAQQPTPLATQAPAQGAPAGAMAPQAPQQAVSPLAAVTNPQQGRQPSGGYISPITGKPDPSMATLMVLDPAEAAKQMAIEGMIAYQNTGNIQYLQHYAPQEYQILATARDTMSVAQRNELATKFDALSRIGNSALGVAQAYGPKSPDAVAAYKRAVIMAQNGGLITPQVADAELNAPNPDWASMAYFARLGQTMSESLVSSGTQAGNIAKATEPYQGRYTMPAVDSNGNAIIFNSRTGQYEVTDTKLGAKPTGAGTSTFESKKAAWLAANPGDEQGALQYASGMKVMQPAQIEKVATDQALREQYNWNQDMSHVGQPFDLQGAIARNKAALTAANTMGAPTGATPGAPGQQIPGGQQVTPPVPGASANADAYNRVAAGHTVAQDNAVRAYYGILQREHPNTNFGKYALGTPQNPFVPNNKQEYDGVKPGQWFVRYDGWIGPKPAPQQ